MGAAILESNEALPHIHFEIYESLGAATNGDNVFSDGVELPLPEITGSVAAGYASSLAIGIVA